jgi:hypothetical protein
MEAPGTHSHGPANPRGVPVRGATERVKAAMLVSSAASSERKKRIAQLQRHHAALERPNRAFAHLADVSRRVSGMEKEQAATIRALDRLLGAVGFDREEWVAYHEAKEGSGRAAVGWRDSGLMRAILAQGPARGKGPGRADGGRAGRAADDDARLGRNFFFCFLNLMRFFRSMGLTHGYIFFYFAPS